MDNPVSRPQTNKQKLWEIDEADRWLDLAQRVIGLPDRAYERIAKARTHLARVLPDRK